VHYETFDVIPPELAGRIVALGQDLARRMKAAYGVERVAFLFTGGDVPHAHAHVVPMHEKTDVTSARYVVSPPALSAPGRPEGDGLPGAMSGHPGRLTYVAPVFRVADLARSLAYYRDRLGFEVEFEYEGFYAGVVRDGCRIHLKCAPAVARDQSAFESAEQLDACFGVEGVETLASRFASAGAVFSVALRHMPYGIEFYVKDPDGYILGFVQPAET
jgi:catechol 2,3-dioxygenase-like lactoylglutathione lyase family enzyme